MNSVQFRKASPRRVGPKVVRLQQISTGGNSIPRRGGQPSIRGTEASTQAVIRAVYAQILGNAGYAGERNTVEEIKLENGDINLREFIRQVARSNAFRRRYWSGLYICKAIEIMHRRLLGRPTFGRWEINAYFDTAARQRFLTAADRNARKVPALRRAFDPTKFVDLTPASRPDVPQATALRTVADTVTRNLPQRRPPVVGSWSAQLVGGESMAPPRPPAPGPESLRQAPVPTRSWRPSPSNGPLWPGAVG
jgi:phycobilisome core-membrane linker protein